MFQRNGNAISVGSKDGILQLYSFKDSKLHLSFESENIQLLSGGPAECDEVKALINWNEKIYYSDNGVNLKLLEWKTGRTHFKNVFVFQFCVRMCMVFFLSLKTILMIT